MKGFSGLYGLVVVMLAVFCGTGLAHGSSQPYLGEHGINFATGNKYLVARDVSLSGPVELSFTRTYNSQSAESGPLGYGWSSVLSERVVEAEGGLTLVRHDGRHVAFGANADGSYTAVLGAGDRIVRNNGGFRLRKANRDLRDYDGQGRLLAASQAGGLGFTCTYSGDGLSLIRDSLGRELRFSYSGGRLSVLGTPVGEFRYSYDGSGNLVELRHPDGTSERYEYDGAHNLRGVIDGAGLRVQSLSYDGSDRVVESVLAGGLGRVRIAYPGALSRRVTDAAGVESSYELGVQGGVARVVREQGSGCSACGEETGSSCEYGGRLQTARVRDGKGGITSSSHVDQGNLSRLVRRGSGYGDDQCGLELQPPSRVQGAGSGQRSFCTC